MQCRASVHKQSTERQRQAGENRPRMEVGGPSLIAKHDLPVAIAPLWLWVSVLLLRANHLGHLSTSYAVPMSGGTALLRSVLDSQNAVHKALLTLTTTTCVGAAIIYSQNSSLPSTLPCYQPSQRRGRAATVFFPLGNVVFWQMPQKVPWARQIPSTLSLFHSSTQVTRPRTTPAQWSSSMLILTAKNVPDYRVRQPSHFFWRWHFKKTKNYDLSWSICYSLGINASSAYRFLAPSVQLSAHSTP